MKKAFVLVSICLGLFFAAQAGAATFLVDNTGDAADDDIGNGVCHTAGNVCTLRAAIQEANFIGGLDTINFGIAGGGVKTIAPGLAFPTISEPVILNGTSQPGYAGLPLIEVDGTNAGNYVFVFNPGSGGSTIKGFIVNRCTNGITFVTDGNTIQANYIGTDSAGVNDLGCAGFGIELSNADNNVIGGTSASERNVISGHGGNGISLHTGSTGNVIRGNYIGTNAAGTAAIANLSNGIQIVASPANTIGGTAAGAGNLISGNNQEGIKIDDVASTGNTIQGNLIGLNAAGTAALANQGYGIQIFNAPNTTIGGTASGARNVISGNGFVGIGIGPDNDVTGTVIQGNYIGTNAAGTAAVANSGTGIQVDGAANTTIGGSVSGARNVISGNNNHGIEVYGAGVTATTIQGNLIGLNASGSGGVPNASFGIIIVDPAVDTTIGGTNGGEGNTIAFNGDSGVIANSTTGWQKIQGNSIYSNGSGNGDLGIDLNQNGVTANDEDDPDAGPNGLQNFPVLTSAVYVGGGVTINGTFNSTASTGFRIEFFANDAADDSGHGEGKLFLGAIDNAMTNAGGDYNIAAAQFPAILTGSQFITATATNNTTNNTSEFSAAFNVVAPGTLQLSNNTYTVNENAGTVTITVTRTDGTEGAVTVDYTTANDTASAGSDYTTTAGTLNFANGEASKTFQVPLLNDPDEEGNETFEVTISNPGGGAILGVPPMADVTIVDDETCGNGILGTGEECDAGNANSDTTADACRTTCLNAHCGDGVQDTEEQCDNANSDTNPDACRTSCLNHSCGDEVTDTGETCDDGNNVAGDGCNDECGIEMADTGAKVTEANPDVDFTALEKGDTVTLNAPDPRGGGGALKVAFLAKAAALPGSCACDWAIDPATLGSYSSENACETDLSLDGTGDGMLSVDVDCGPEGSGSFQQAITVGEAGSGGGSGGSGSGASGSSGGCSLMP